MQGVAAGTEHIHKQGIGHGDIKPENVLMVPYEGRHVPQLADFGMARGESAGTAGIAANEGETTTDVLY